MLLRFSGLDSKYVYMFITKFVEVCTMLKIMEQSVDATMLWFIPFALKDSAKKWLYNLAISSIRVWEEFVAVFLRIFFDTQNCENLKHD